jgi:hypothetical protein
MNPDLMLIIMIMSSRIANKTGSFDKYDKYNNLSK